MKKAFCVGINDYPFDGSDLNGCVNDATAWAALLVDHFDFPRSDVKLVLDSEATKRDMLAGKIQECYGIAKDDAERQVREFEKRSDDRWLDAPRH